jgi:hypothetical protein
MSKKKMDYINPDRNSSVNDSDRDIQLKEYG